MRQGVIAAISTPPGKGGVAIIRMSGRGCFDIADEVFAPKSKKRISDYPPRTQIYGYIIYNGERIDDGLLTEFPAPGSYTGEDTVEISCHGGTLVTRTVLEALYAKGAIPAEAGEFTTRAFLNGRLTLSAAEAIGTLLEAKSHEQIRLASEPARAKLNGEIEAIRCELLDIMSSMYARIDYPDEDLGDIPDEVTLEKLCEAKSRISRLISTYRTGRAINEGISAVICGKPNVGKSTLYNLLLGEDAAIVTDIEGTTRDVLERTVPLGRVLLRLTDTAGIRERVGMDAVERIGIERTKDRIQTADLILAVFDLSRPFDEDDEDTLEAIRNSDATKICVLNKTDAEIEGSPRERTLDVFDEVISISAAKNDSQASELLIKTVERLFTDEKITTVADAIVSSARQHGTLLLTEGFIDTAIDALRLGMPADAASSDIERAIGALSELDGRGVSESVVNDIFSKFCVGK